MDAATVATVSTAVVIVLGGLVAWFRWLRKPWRNVVRFFGRLDLTINGRPAEIDPYGHEIHPAVPALADQMIALNDKVDAMAERDARMTAFENTLAEHGQRLTAIEAGHQLERSLGHVAQAKTFDAIEAVARKRDTDDPEK